MILLLDNYDSFVHNLARYFRRLGRETRVIRSDEIDAPGCRALDPEAIVISPGPKHPGEAGCSVQVIRELSAQIPMLGVCLGHQSIGVAFGGLVVRCSPEHGIQSPITHHGHGIFENCALPMKVGRYHSLAIDRATFPSELEITAQTDDGVIMGIQHRTLPLFGVQFHPESILTDQGNRLIENFFTIASKRRQELVL
ncbi:Anthranilate synthase component 2 [Novipirellula galeiformis]|uniref:Anthranilate synthase component 2 n=1 Tax=Novipirellula galeiformis TaxID=2528004 RepID=A0A5C6CSW5_9BACT|nr:aminodeoxychorismate/anthranilate synthase component II [Novipirellula galeiformis]TWU26975.1 Anthranilate synthase component 2 [Novipirellula galeiformis]